MEIVPAQAKVDRVEALHKKAKELEAAFMAEMLGYAGVTASEGAFSGGQGEEHFSSFLRQAQAEAMVEKGGVGLAEMIFRSLAAAEGQKND